MFHRSGSEAARQDSGLAHLLDRNAAWAEEMVANDPLFFARLQAQQTPQYLWIGCSDSRVPANEIIGLRSGELFVHRNVANVVIDTDVNCLSVLQYAVDVLRVRHVIVTGHYGCGGVLAAFDGVTLGLSDNWLRHVVDVRRSHQRALTTFPRDEALNRLCELNVIEQAKHVCDTSIVRDAWERGQPVRVHGWIYGLHDGRLRDLECGATGAGDVLARYERAVHVVTA